MQPFSLGLRLYVPVPSEFTSPRFDHVNLVAGVCKSDGYLSLCLTCQADQLDYFPSNLVCVNKDMAFYPLRK